MKINQTKIFTVITPEDGFKLSTLDKSQMYEGEIYLGKYDSADNYIEVTVAEYEEWIKSQQEEVQLNGR